MSTVQTGEAIISDRLTLIREVDVVEAAVAVTIGVMAGSICRHSAPTAQSSFYLYGRLSHCKSILN
jgi:hypothetical protein